MDRAAVRRVFVRVAEQIDQHLLQMRHVADQEFMIHCRRRHKERLLLGMEHGDAHGLNIRQQIRKDEVFPGDGHLSAFNLGKIQHVIHQVQQML